MALIEFNDEYFMKQAFKEAQHAFDEGEVPIGAVIVCNNKIIARAHNQTERLNDVTAHAEILAYTSATEYIGSKYLKKCTLYVTLEPCAMCAGACSWSQISNIVYGASDPKKGFTSVGSNMLHPKTVVKSGIMKVVCGEIIKQFFEAKR
ncbi:MAG: nucleoside deaminase [Flavobacteriales bacterium]|nr:nucleoside deaminase [Flavobacteriales bacterium]